MTIGDYPEYASDNLSRTLHFIVAGIGKKVRTGRIIPESTAGYVLSAAPCAVITVK